MKRCLAVVLACGLAACTSVPLAREESLVASEYRVDADDTLAVTVEAQPGVVITDDERARCTRILGERIARSTEDTVADGKVRAWTLAVRISRYDHGDPFKRRMRAGMGSMYIDSQVTLSDADGKPVGEFAANRAYEWGGKLGEQATIDDLEVMLGDYLGRAIASRSTGPAAGKDVPVEKALFGPSPKRNKAQQNAPIR